MTDKSIDNKRNRDAEKNRFAARAARYARVSANVGGVAARYARRRMLGGEPDRASEASALASALGRLKGPLMKVAQLMATIPDLLPPEYAAELQKLQSEAPPMGWAFVKRRMMAELGRDWEKKFASFEHHPAAAAGWCSKLSNWRCQSAPSSAVMRRLTKAQPIGGASLCSLVSSAA